jgi:hypothetical protein
LTIYSTKTYAQEDEHAEFIAYYSETFSSPPSLELEKVFALVADYIDKFLMPNLTQFAANHPNHHLIEDSTVVGLID